MGTYEQLVERWLGLPADVVTRLLSTLVVFIAVFAIRRVARSLLQRTIDDSAQRFQVSRAITYVFGFTAAGILAKIWIQGVTGLATYFGLLSAGVAIALQDPLTNFVGWIFILARRPFRVGDRIQIGTHMGDVVDIRMFRFVLLEIGNWVHADQSTGRILHVPNGLLFKNPLANYDEAFGYIWNELELIVTFESNWRRAKEILQKTLDDHADEIGPDIERRIDERAHDMHIQLAKITPVVWTSLVDSGIRLTMRYLCKARERRSSASEIWEASLDALAAAEDVDVAYPTTRYFDNRSEGKVGKTGPMP
ncbi:MAG TPA: mechanosensitive ion channel domain-containing protein [Labilithrix sp.]|jgi:small-conductance mechanosensitive channel